MIKMTHTEWCNEAARRFGPKGENWRFVCPVCGHVASVKDWAAAGAPQGAVAFSCVGRWTGAGPYKKGEAGPCNYAGGGLFRLNPVTVTDCPGGGEYTAFNFAPEEGAPNAD